MTVSELLGCVGAAELSISRIGTQLFHHAASSYWQTSRVVQAVRAACARRAQEPFSSIDSALELCLGAVPDKIPPLPPWSVATPEMKW